MKKRYFFLSLTRIADFTQDEIEIIPIDKKDWKIGQYVACKVVAPPGTLRVELKCGRMAEIAEGDILVGAFGDRFATLEATGSYTEIGDDNRMQLLTSAGIFGKVTSISSFIPNLIELEYLGNVHRDNKPISMKDYTSKKEYPAFNTPVVLIVGTSMSAGKTTAAKIVIRQLRLAGLKVIAGKITGAGRYRDTLGMYDAGAEFVVDFVDAGLPSTIVPANDYIKALHIMLGEIQDKKGDVVVIEIGASPMEPYNGSIAIKYINQFVKFRILCASDPYAVYGVMKAFGSKPDVVCGIATNTLGGRKLIEKLCDVPSLNIIYPDQLKIFTKLLNEKVVKEIPLHTI
jgi:hypothetical protein